MTILRLNMRHQLPQTSLRIRDSSLDESSMVPAQIHTNDQQARSNKTVTQPSIEVDSYQSRRDYGARTLTDLTREFGQKGLSDVRENRTRTTDIAWSRARNGAKPGDDIAQQMWNEMFSKYSSAESMVQMGLMEGTVTRGHPSEVIGDPDLGDVTAEIETTPFARLSGTQGSAQTYVANQGFLRRWVTVNEYDIYA